MKDKHAQDCSSIKKDLDIALDKRNKLQAEYDKLASEKKKAEQDLEDEITDLENNKAFWLYDSDPASPVLTIIH